MPATLGIKLAKQGHQGIEAELVVNAVGDGSALFYPQVWWTASQNALPVLYLIMNNMEYRTLRQGLDAVIRYYQDAPYAWKPVTLDPAYLHIGKPDMNFVELARSFGVAAGRRVERPEEVKGALKEGLDCVFTKKQAFVLKLFTERDPQTATPALLPQEKRLQLMRSREKPPPLDIYYYSKKGLL